MIQFIRYTMIIFISFLIIFALSQNRFFSKTPGIKFDQDYDLKTTLPISSGRGEIKDEKYSNIPLPERKK